MSDYLREYRNQTGAAGSVKPRGVCTATAPRDVAEDNNENMNMSADDAARGNAGFGSQGQATKSHQPAVPPPQRRAATQPDAFTGLERPMGGLSMSQDTDKLAQYLHRRLSLGGCSLEQIQEAMRDVQIDGNVRFRDEGALQSAQDAADYRCKCQLAAQVPTEPCVW